MALFSPTFILGVVVLLYVLSFVLFAVIRIVTGLSIQRIGYFSLRRLAYVPRDGLKIEIRGLGINIHRPTFSQPTWLSLVVSELVVTVDTSELEGLPAADNDDGSTCRKTGGNDEDEDDEDEDDETQSELTGTDADDSKQQQQPKQQLKPSTTTSSTPTTTKPCSTKRRYKAAAGVAAAEEERSKTWRQLTKIKERIKRLHRNVNWLRMVDVVATNSAVNVVGVGNVQFGSFTVAVDTRRKMVDRDRLLFQTRHENPQEMSQAEWIMTLRSVLFTPEGRESMEIVDNATLNIHGFLYEALDGLRDAAIALKLGRVHLPYDDLLYCSELYRQIKKAAFAVAALAPSHPGEPPTPMSPILEDDPFLTKTPGEQQQDASGPRDETAAEKTVTGTAADADGLVQTVADSKEFVSSLLRGIKEVQFAVSFLGIAKKVQTVKSTGAPVLLMNLSMKEIGVDLHRLDPKSPAHRMYFSSKDIAHEALAAALSISLGVDDGHGKPQRLMYIPMATTTVKTTLPSKSVEMTMGISAEEKNANILFANSVVTSPSVDLNPRHLPLLLAMLSRPRTPRRRHASPPTARRHILISRLLPKANIKFSMHEPVVRIALPPVNPSAHADDFDLIISSISSISLDIESFHSAVQEMHYSLASALRLQTHNLFYQTSAGSRFDLLQTESFDLKTQLNASPDVHVVASANLQTFSVKLVRPEIIAGLRQIIKQLRPTVVPDKKRLQHSKPKEHVNFLRRIPAWLMHFQVQASDFGMEAAGVDARVSDESRGMAVQLETWTVEYRAQRLDHQHNRRTAARRRTISRSVLLPDTDFLTSVPVSPRKKHHHNGDGRRIAFHGRGLEAFIVESTEKWEMDPFVNVPRFEVAFSTLSDNQGPVFHIHSHVRTLLIHYSLQRHYSISMAAMVLKQAFAHPSLDFATKKLGVAEPLPSGHAPTNSEVVATSPTRLLPPTPKASVDHDGSAGRPQSRELVAVDVKVTLVQIKADLPSDPPLMLQIHSLETGRHRWSPPFLYWKLIRLHAEAPRMPKVWARLFSIKNGRLECKETRTKLPTSGYKMTRSYDISTDVIRIGVPHELVLYKIFDNVVNTFKSVIQLHHRFKTGTDEYILGKKPEGPKQIPRVSVRCRTFAFELEDGAFEWKLGMIYRAGRIEQMQRLAREEAFRVKVKKIQEDEARRESSKFRARSAAPRGRTAHAAAPAAGGARSRSDDRLRTARAGNETQGFGRTPRYDPEGSSLGMTGNAHVTISEARHRLNLHNARGWKQRIDRSYQMAHKGMKELRSMLWGEHTSSDDLSENENILGVPNRPALMTTIIDDLHLVVDKPTFPIKELPDFLYKVGKGMPKDMLYTLLIPVNLQIFMGEAKVTLRDYPLPLLHVPSIASNQSSKLHALALSTDFVIAEEFQGPESIRHIKVDILPPKSTEPGASREGNFAIDVLRTTSQVKTYSDMNIDINTSLPTKITWGPSYQPAIQDMMMVFESFTKPQLDPSENVGFWDKIRLSFHSRVRVAWKADGDVHLALKGTRDPYQVTGNGAGFLMCWRNDVRWNIHVDDDPKQFMMVDSGEYVLAVPDYSHHAREVNRQSTDEDSVTSDNSLRSGAAFKKVVMKLSGKVQWLAGLVFERAIDDGQRNFDFAPHYSIFLKSPQHAHPQGGLPYDAFRGFRSQHIHMSIAVRAPVDREWSVSNSEPSRSYNTVHLSPRFFTHFFAWWSLFSGPMSLPIRQGKLWPGCEKNSKKFGRHLATIKYNLLLAPLFLSHIYKHKDTEDHVENAISATGIKVRFDSFMLDLHQRREEFNTRDKGRKTQSRTTGMKIHACQLDLASADIRAVSASIRGITADNIQEVAMSHYIHNEDEAADVSRFMIPDEDFSWVDMDDFVELDWILPTEPNPDTKIFPLAFAPRITYFRQTDIGGVISGDPDRTSPFGHEPTHLCIMTPDDDPRTVQMHLVRTRLQQLEDQINNHVRDINEAVRRINTETNAFITTEIETLSRQANVLQEKKSFLENSLRLLVEEASAAATARAAAKASSKAATEAREARRRWREKRDKDGGQQPSPSSSASSPTAFEAEGTGDDGVTEETANTTAAAADGEEKKGPDSGAEFASEFTNRFVVHNMKLKWNNMLRNIILRYIHQVSQRRGFVYYLSRPAVKFIIDIVEEQVKLKTAAATSAMGGGGGGGGGISGDASSVATGNNMSGSSVPGMSQQSDVGAGAGGDRSGKDIEDRIRKILQDGRKFVSADEAGGGNGCSDGKGAKKEGTVYSTPMEDLACGIAAEFTPQNSYHVHLIAPQIQLQSDKNKKHVVLVTAKGMELKVVEVMDKARLSDNVSGLVQRRFLVGMDSTQFFVTHRKWFSTRILSAYSGTSYGSPSGSSWPPWVPMEAMFDFQTDPFGFKRVVQKTSATLRYDKYNTLRLKYNEGVNNTGNGTEGVGAASPENIESRMDNLWVEFPQARALCNSSQYYAIYVIVLDLLMYNEPLEKTRSERLEKIMLASDFSDLRGAPEMVIRLQERVRQLEDIKTHFQIHSKTLDQRGWEERLLLERDLAACEDELFFIMKAITTSQSRNDASQSNALLKWSISAREIVWHLMRDTNEPLVELQLKDVEYDRTDNADGSHINLIQVGKILGLNLLPDAIYPEMIAPYLDERGPLLDIGGTEPMVRVYWYMLEAIAGITVMDHFEVTLFPMKIQLEHEVGKKIFEYIFPGTDGDKANASNNGNNNNNDASSFAKQSDDDTEDEEYTYSMMQNSGGRNRLGSAVSERDRDAAFDTQPSSLELRLRPTLTSNQNQRSSTDKQKAPSVHSATDPHSFRFFRQPTGGSSKSNSLLKKPSYESLQNSSGPLRIGVGRSSTGFSSMAGSSGAGGGSSADTSKKSSRFMLRSSKTDDKQNANPSDDLTKMITRASSYMTFAYIRLPSVVLCLSYKGKGERNIEDVHDFVFRLPTIEYRNKTWSNLDLALALKSRVIKALISHTGAIIGNKLSKHRPNTAQQSKLRELATSSMLLSTPALHEGRGGGGGGGGGGGDMSDDSSSIFGTSPDFSRSPPRSLRGSQTSIPLPRSASRSSSLASSNRSYIGNAGGSGTYTNGGGYNNGGGGNGGRVVTVNTSAGPVPQFMMMTPPTPQHEFSPGSSSLPPSRHSNNNNNDYLRPDSRSSSLMFGGSGSGGGGGGSGGHDAGDRKKSAFGGVRNKLSALASRVKDRDSSSGHNSGNNSGSGGSSGRLGVHSSHGGSSSSYGGAGFVGEDNDATPVRRRETTRPMEAAGGAADYDDDADDADTDVPSQIHRGMRTKTT
ncbi:Protein SABRE [Sporothrix curviconia]|uniref:Protein SABRE n=1 Tax=Sporothrix curviconia TaxID=1260050 RepID=A0ABP0ATK4_9PEZI